MFLAVLPLVVLDAYRQRALKGDIHLARLPTLAPLMGGRGTPHASPPVDSCHRSAMQLSLWRCIESRAETLYGERASRHADVRFAPAGNVKLHVKPMLTW